MQTSPDTPATHPIILHTDVHAEDERAPQTQFVVERQRAFLWGSQHHRQRARGGSPQGQ